MAINPTRTYKSLPGRIAEAVIAFVSEPASACPLAFFRIGISAVVLFQGLGIAGYLLELYGINGIIPWTITDELITAGIPRLSWAAQLLEPFNVNADDSVRLFFGISMGSLVGLLVGWRTRLMAVVAWLTHLAIHSTGESISYGVDVFANIALFYCVVMPVADCLSLDRYLGRVSGQPSSAARLSLRVLQIHLCIIYFSAGYSKAFQDTLWNGFWQSLRNGDFWGGLWSGDWRHADWWTETRVHGDWWDGEAIWVTLMQQQFTPFDFSWLAYVPWVAKLLCWGTLAVELGYSFLVWPRWTRKPWVLFTIGMHLGIALAMWLWSFSLALIVFNIACFLVPAEVPEPTRKYPLRPRATV